MSTRSDGVPSFVWWIIVVFFSIKASIACNEMLTPSSSKPAAPATPSVRCYKIEGPNWWDDGPSVEAVVIAPDGSRVAPFDTAERALAFIQKAGYPLCK